MRSVAGVGNGDVSLGNGYFLTHRVLAVTVVWLLMVVMVMTEGRSVDWVGNSFGNTRNTTAEAMVLAVVVVVAHITLVLGGIYCAGGSSLDVNSALGTRKV